MMTRFDRKSALTYLLSMILSCAAIGLALPASAQVAIAPIPTPTMSPAPVANPTPAALPTPAPAPLPKTLKPTYFPNGQKSVIVPFDDYSNLVLVQTQIDNRGPLTFAIDTAFQSGLIDAKVVQSLNLPAVHASKPGADSAHFVAFDAKIAALNLPVQTAKVVSLSNLTPLLGVRIDGIFGLDIFQHLAATINYDTGAIRFTRNRTLVPPTDATVFPITQSPKGLLIPIVLQSVGGESIKTEAKTDTGSTEGIELTDSFVKSSKIFDGNQTEILIPNAGNVSPGETAYASRIGGITLGPWFLPAPVAIHNNDVIPQPYGAVLGGRILRRYEVTIDLFHSRLYLAPNSRQTEIDYYDGSGLTLNAVGTGLHTFTVVDVSPYTPAVDAGFRVGDVIQAINDEPSESFTLADVRSLFSQPKKHYSVTVLRDGKPVSLNLIIKPRL